MSTPKYNRTFHAPWSEGATSDDKIAKSVEALINVPIIISEKIDGGNCSLEYDGCYARTHAAPPTHPSFDFIKSFHANIKHLIPKNIQIFGENVYALHTIKYSELPHYFLLFNVRDLDSSIWSSWDEVELWANEIQAPTVPVLFRGSASSEEELKDLTKSLMKEPSACGGQREGVVVRFAGYISDDMFSYYVIKVVRKNHVDAKDDHWINKPMVKNGLRHV
jgi:hypothetical protein